MKYRINEEDKLLFSQGALDYKYRLSVMKGSRFVDVIYGISQLGTYGISGESDIRWRWMNFRQILRKKSKAGSAWILNLKSACTAS